MQDKAVGKKVDASVTFAQYGASLKYEDIPAEVREVTKRAILDTLGIAIGGSTTRAGLKELVELIKDGGGKEESTILAFGGKVPAWMAAFANGALAKALDYDETHDDAIVHPSITSVPAALAVAERMGKVNGKELITAVALGNEITCRMALSITKRPKGWKADWSLSSVHGVFGATTACGKLLGLNANKMQDALGLALYQASETTQGHQGAGCTIRGMYSCFPAKAAVISALMAEKGIGGPADSLEGQNGLYNLYFEGEYNRDVLTADLGKTFEYANVSLKPWPNCRFCHPYIEATLQIVGEHDIASEDISRITIFVGDFAHYICEPLEMRRQPQTPFDADISLPYAVAVAASKRKVLINDFTTEGIKDPATLQMAQRVVPKFDAQFNFSQAIGPAMVEIELMNGRSHSRRVDIPYGHPKNPMTWQDLLEKFRHCTSYSVKPLSKENIEKAIELIIHLEDTDDVSQIVQLLA